MGQSSGLWSEVVTGSPERAWEEERKRYRPEISQEDVAFEIDGGIPNGQVIGAFRFASTSARVLSRSLEASASPQPTQDEREVAAAIKRIDTSHPITTVYGELPSVDTINSMPNIDIWGINSYRGITFGDLFSQWSNRSQKPMFIAEYGADSFNANINREDQQAQADATHALTLEILNNASNGNTLGGTIFEWSDEWWKAGNPNSHDTGGIAPGGGPYPDMTFNEEWWGLVTVDRQPKQAYYTLQNLYLNH